MYLNTFYCRTIVGLIGFVGGMVGLVLGVLRFPLVLGNEISASVTASFGFSSSIR